MKTPTNTPEPLVIAAAIASIQAVTEKNNRRLAVLKTELIKLSDANDAMRLEHAELLRKADSANRLR